MILLPLVSLPFKDTDQQSDIHKLKCQKQPQNSQLIREAQAINLVPLKCPANAVMLR